MTRAPKTTCPGCGTEVKIVGKTTMHYEPVIKYEIRYKTCRAAFRRMSDIYEREKKERVKVRQRIIQACNDGRQFSSYSTTHFNQILGLLKVAGYEDDLH